MLYRYIKKESPLKKIKASHSHPPKTKMGAQCDILGLVRTAQLKKNILEKILWYH